MPGNSQRKGAARKPGSKKGATTGSGGQRRKGLVGRGATPPAEKRPHHPAAKRATKAAKSSSGAERRGGSARSAKAPELLVGRNPVVEALRAGIPSTALYVAQGIDLDERVTEAVTLASNRGLPVLEVARGELDRMSNRALHQGVGVAVPPFDYADPDDVIATGHGEAAGLLVALDGVTDPRNLGAVIRSAAAFGAQAVLLPERRAASMTATAWRTSAGAAARIPVAKVTNLARTLKQCQHQGYQVIGLDAEAGVGLAEIPHPQADLVVVVGSEGKGLGRLVGQTCDLRVGIPMHTGTESLNASVAAAVTLAEIDRRRRALAFSPG